MDFQKPKDAQELTFGDKATFTHKFVRNLIDKGDGYQSIWKVWEEYPDYHFDAIFLGYRMLQNGFRDYDSEYGYTFITREYVKAALACPGERLNPIYVPLNRIWRQRG